MYQSPLYGNELAWLNVKNRITSYNVCYTKLLRYFATPQLAVIPDRYYACFPSEVTLEANSSDAVSFLWESIEGKELGSEQNLKVDSTALYKVTVWNEYGCSTTDTADVIVFGRPPVTISADSLVCSYNFV